MDIKLPFNDCLSSFKNKKVDVINNFHGSIDNIPSDAKVAIYCLIGENREATSIIPRLTQKFPSAYLFIISPIKYETDIKFNGEFIWQPTAYAGYYSKCLPKLTLDDILNRKLDKHFLSLNNRAEFSRHALWQLMVKFELLDKSFFSYLFHDRFNKGDALWLNMQSLTYPAWFNEKINWEEKKSMLPLRLDDFINNSWSYDNIDYYQKSFISIVTETYPKDFLTEKAMKPLAYGHPFVILNCQNSLDILKNLGFYTFPELLDESYDQYWGVENIERCFNEILKMSKLSKDVLQTKLSEISFKLTHNYNQFWHVIPKQDRDFVEHYIKPKIEYKIKQLT